MDPQYGAAFPTREFRFMVLEPRKPKPGAPPRRPADCLREAPEFDLDSFPRRVVLSRELPSTDGARTYLLLDSPASLVHHVLWGPTGLQSRRRPMHYYAVVERNTACFLYLDIDVEHRVASPMWRDAVASGTSIDLVGAVCSAVRSYLSEQTGLTLARRVDCWLPYQSRPPLSHKTSFHVHAGLAFESVQELGEWMSALGRLWTAESDESGLSFVRNYLCNVVDPKVYTPDRNFRLAYSSKADRTDVKTAVWHDVPRWWPKNDMPKIVDWTTVLASTVLCRNSMPLWSPRTVVDRRLLEQEMNDYGPTEFVGGPSRGTPSFRCLPTMSTVRELEERMLPEWEREPPIDISAVIRRYLSSMLHEERPPPAEIAALAARSGRSLVAVLLCIGAFALPGGDDLWRDADQIVLHASDIASSTTPAEIAYHCLMAVAGSERDYSHNTLELKRTEEDYVEEVLAPWFERLAVTVAAPTTTPLVEWFSLARIALSRSEVHRLRFLSTRPHSTLREDALQLDETTWARAVLRAWSERRAKPSATPRPVLEKQQPKKKKHEAGAGSGTPHQSSSAFFSGRLAPDPYDQPLLRDSDTPDVNTNTVLQTLASLALELCTHLLGSGPTNESVGEIRWRSLVIYKPTTAKPTGGWHWYKEGVGGDFFELIIRVRRFRERVRKRLTAPSEKRVKGLSFVLALRYAVAFLRDRRRSGAPQLSIVPSSQRTEQDRIDDAQRRWQEAAPLSGLATSDSRRARVISYLTGRRRIKFIDTALIEWRFHDRFSVAGHGHFPAILCPLRAPSLAPTTDKSVRGVHAILLSGWENGRTLLIDNSKRTIGCMHGSAIPVALHAAYATVAFVAEGCETALSVLDGLVGHELFAKSTVWAVAGKSNYAHFAAPPGTETLYLCADNDGKGDREMREVASQMAQRHHGVRLLLLMPPLVPGMAKSDFNDWQCHLQDAVPWRLRFAEMLRDSHCCLVVNDPCQE